MSFEKRNSKDKCPNNILTLLLPTTSAVRLAIPLFREISTVQSGAFNPLTFITVQMTAVWSLNVKPVKIIIPKPKMFCKPVCLCLCDFCGHLQEAGSMDIGMSLQKPCSTSRIAGENRIGTCKIIMAVSLLSCALCCVLSTCRIF